MSSIDVLLPEILHLIAGTDMTTYYGLIRAYPRFARLITNGIRFDYAISFGIDYHINDSYGDRRAHWTLNGKLHRADGPAVCSVNGTNNIWYYIHGLFHRTNGPAAVHDNGATWYFNYGKCHRTDGPASIVNDKVQWYIDGEPINEAEFNDWRLANICNIYAMPDDILHLIAGESMATYHGLVCAMPRFARLITNGVRFDYAEKFGIDCHVSPDSGCPPRIVWTLNGVPHRADGPAIVGPQESYCYMIRGLEHRTDGPSMVRDAPGFIEQYCIRDEFHREDGPARIWKNSAGGQTMYYYINNKLHREGAPAIIYSDYRVYFINNKLHREDGPAYEGDNGYYEYRVNGELHREDGPARHNPPEDDSYYIRGKQLTYDEFAAHITHGVAP